MKYSVDQILNNVEVSPQDGATEVDKAQQNENMQISIMYWFFEDSDFRSKYIDLFATQPIFSYEGIKTLLTIYLKEYSEGKVPTRREMKILIQKPTRYDVTISEYDYEFISRILYTERYPFLSMEFVEEHLQEFLTEMIGMRTATNILEAITSNKPFEITGILQSEYSTLDAITEQNRDTADIDYDALVESVTDAARRLSTGLVHVDCAMGGGLARGELMTVLGRTKSGKSHFLVNQMYANMLKGHHVLYLSFENGVMDIQRRLMSRASGMYYNQMRRVPDHLKRDRIEEIRERTAYLQGYGKHLILHRPPNTLTYKDLRGLMTRMESMVGARPDLVIIDYADYLNIVPVTGQRVEGYDKHETVYYELGAFAQEHDIGISTVTQVNRSGSSKQKEDALIGIEDVAKSVGKINASDYAFSLNPMARSSIYQYGVLKSLTSRSSQIQEFVFPYRSLLGMSYYETIDIYEKDPVQYLALPTSLYEANDPAIATEINRAMDEDMKAYASLLKPPLVEEQEEKERKMLEELARVTRS